MSAFLCECGCPLDAEGYCTAGCDDGPAPMLDEDDESDDDGWAPSTPTNEPLWDDDDD